MSISNTTTPNASNTHANANSLRLDTLSSAVSGISTSTAPITAFNALKYEGKQSDGANDNEHEGDIVDNSGQLQTLVQSARDAYSLSKSNAAYAAAHSYMLWREIEKSSEANAWFENAIKKRNDEIDAYNKEREEGKSRENIREGLNACDKLVKISSREGASKFTLLVKYALDFVVPKQASNVSRYTLVLEWIDRHFATINVVDVSDIVSSINSVGGFEHVVLQQRGIAKPKVKAPDGDKASITQAKYKTLSEAKCLSKLKLNAKHQNKGYVVLVARYVEGKAEILGELPISEKQLDQAVAAIDEMKFQPPKQLAA